MPQFNKRGNRIRASDKSLVFRFSAGSLFLLFLAMVMLLNLKTILTIDWKAITLFQDGSVHFTVTPYMVVTVIVSVLVCATVALFYDILLQKDFTVDISIPETTIFVQGDKDALQRILFNLISNVIRYGNDGKYLGIFLREDKANVYIDVTDKGKGIKKEFASNVFDRLYTMEDSRNREIQGNGLGLTIAKNLAVQLDGDIFLDSIPNIKTTFTVKLKKISY